MTIKYTPQGPLRPICPPWALVHTWLTCVERLRNFSGSRLDGKRLMSVLRVPAGSKWLRTTQEIAGMLRAGVGAVRKRSFS
jgi:hypothetical protein